MYHIAFEKQVQNYSRAVDAINEYGYPYWDTHPAKELLREDVKNGVTDCVTPKVLWESSAEYQQFPLHVFARRFYKAKYNAKASVAWQILRNKKAQKQQHDEAKANKDSWYNLHVHSTNKDVNREGKA